MDDRNQKDENPGKYVTLALCKAYQATMEQRIKNLDTKMDGLRNTIITGLSLATAIISLIVLIANYLKM